MQHCSDNSNLDFNLSPELSSDSRQQQDRTAHLITRKQLSSEQQTASKQQTAEPPITRHQLGAYSSAAECSESAIDVVKMPLLVTPANETPAKERATSGRRVEPSRSSCCLYEAESRTCDILIEPAPSLVMVRTRPLAIGGQVAAPKVQIAQVQQVATAEVATQASLLKPGSISAKERSMSSSRLSQVSNGFVNAGGSPAAASYFRLAGGAGGDAAENSDDARQPALTFARLTTERHHLQIGRSAVACCGDCPASSHLRPPGSGHAGSRRSTLSVQQTSIPRTYSACALGVSPASSRRPSGSSRESGLSQPTGHQQRFSFFNSLAYDQELDSPSASLQVTSANHLQRQPHDQQLPAQHGRSSFSRREELVGKKR